jgi:hypothetical protein
MWENSSCLDFTAGRAPCLALHRLRRPEPLRHPCAFEPHAPRPLVRACGRGVENSPHLLGHARYGAAHLPRTFGELTQRHARVTGRVQSPKVPW